MATSTRRGETKTGSRAAGRRGGRGAYTYDGLLKAIAEPLRRQILRVLHASAASMSASRIEKKLVLSGIPGESIGSLSHHVRSLADYKVIRRVRQRQVRGATERFYASCVEEVPWLEDILSDTREPDEAWLRSKRKPQDPREPAGEKAA